jgi:hypothetical protein
MLNAPAAAEWHTRIFLVGGPVSLQSCFAFFSYRTLLIERRARQNVLLELGYFI